MDVVWLSEREIPYLSAEPLDSVLQSFINYSSLIKSFGFMKLRMFGGAEGISVKKKAPPPPLAPHRATPVFISFDTIFQYCK